MTTRNFSVVYFVDFCIEHAVELDAAHKDLENFCELCAPHKNTCATSDCEHRTGPTQTVHSVGLNESRLEWCDEV